MYTLYKSIEIYTFSNYVRMAPPRLGKQQHVRLHALRGQGCQHLMVLSFAIMILFIPLSRAI